MNIQRRRNLLALPLATALLLSACGTEEDTDTETTTADASPVVEADNFPREVSVGEQTVRVEQAPQRIAVLSGDAAGLVAELVSINRIIAVPDSGGDNPDVETILPGGADADPEQVLALEPDLAVLTTRHGSEEDAAALLEQAGVPAASFDSTAWSSIDDMLATLRTLGELTGTEDRAEELSAELETERGQIRSELSDEKAPRVLALMARGGNRMVMPPSTMLNGLVREAGGVPVVDEQGLQGSAPADPEQIVELAPDVILIEDFRGQGREDFADLITHPALAEVPAIKDERVAYLSRTTTGSSAGTQAVAGLREVAEAIGTVG